jgi:hypothetical protein
MESTARAPKKSSINQDGNNAETPKPQRLSFSERWESERSNKAQKKYHRALKTAYESMKENVFGLVSRDEVGRLARDHGFALCKEESKIPPFEFVLCCALSAVAEQSRGFASIWRILAAACGIKVARSAPVQRFGKASADLMQAVFERAVSRLPLPVQEEGTNKLSMFEQVLADDGSVLKLSPLLEKLFLATRTNTMKAKLGEMEYCRTYDTFDLDASFPCEEADGTKRSVLLRVVGVFNHETEVYHCYVTTLSAEQFSPEEIANLYCLRWVIELLFKLLKSSCHLYHLNTKNPDAMRTFSTHR